MFLRKLQSLLSSRRRAMDRDMREELDSLAALAEDEGATLGNLTRAAEEGRATWMWIWLEELAADLKYAWRMMRRSPEFLLIAVLSLALGIGANTAIFGLMNAILLKTLPVGNPASLVVLTSYSKEGRLGDFGYGDYLALRDAVSNVMAASTAGPIAVGEETAQRKIVSSNYFSVLQLRPALGRFLRDDEDEQPLAVLSDRYWRRSFNASPDAIRKQVDLDGKAFTIVGIAPPEFLSETAGESVDVWTTMALMPPARRSAPGYTWLNLMARGVKPGVITPQLPNRFIARVEIEPGSSGSSGLRNTFAAPLKVLMGVVGVALLIACANLASLLLARAASRQREIATRLAIGARPMRLFRQLITESLALSLLGGALGLALAVWGQGALLNLVSGAGKTISVDLRPDLRVLLFNLGASLLTGLLFGVAPAMHALRGNLPSLGKLRGGLLGAQVALSMVLLIAGGLFVQTLRNLRNQDLGFRAAHVLSVQLRPQGQYRPAWSNLIPELLRRVNAIPGVESAAVSFDGVLGNTGGIKGPFFSTGEEMRAGASWVSPGYFATAGIPLIEGREFSFADTAISAPVVIVSRALAGRGHAFLFNGKSYEIVGVAADTKHGDLRSSARPYVYFAALQSRTDLHSLEVRTSIPPAAVAADLRRVVQDLDPRISIIQTATLDQLIDTKLGPEVLIANLAGFFATLTLLLVALGIYGTVAYSIARRTKEIVIRIALGARPSNITRLVLRQLAVILLIGMTAGTVVAALAAPILAFLLFGLKPTDLATIAGAGLILCLAAAAGVYFPVRRAWRLDPTTALRLE